MSKFTMAAMVGVCACLFASGACHKEPDAAPRGKAFDYVRVKQAPAIAAGGSTRGIPIVIGPRDNQCDVCVNGIDNCGNPCGGGGASTCGAPGQCACSLGDYGLIGLCASRDPSGACTYCAPGTKLTDPCGTECEIVDRDKAPTPDGTRCPPGYDVSCPRDPSCCPSAVPYCCPGGKWCGGDALDCQEIDPAGFSSSSGGGGGAGAGGGSFDCSPTNPQVQCQPLTSCKRCGLSSCGGPNGSACAFYKASDGTIFRANVQANGSSDLSQKATQALQYCGCTN